MADCLFCKVIDGSIPAKIVTQNDKLVAFRDINPQAPTHILIIPKEHIESVKDLKPEQAPIMADIALMAKEIAKQEGLEDFRCVFNIGASAGQSVFHLHMHLLGGRPFSWPPG
ncbi:MAG: histidine triad nucleotide-binding protein [Deltaproteobacteria bacterium]|nr:histidine triad nucleotide-binding protein [Deltaproteobacteria bacterium]